jgi:hypothetical protein
MKNKKILTVLVATTIGVATASSLVTTKAQTLQAAKINHSKKSKLNKHTKAVKVAFGKSYVFPEALQGKWYSKNLLRMEPLDFHQTGLGLPSSGEYVDAVTSSKLKGTKKFPWQMSVKWQNKNKAKLAKFVRISEKKMNGDNWIIVTPISDKTINNSYAFTSKVEEIDGKKETVVFEGNPQAGTVINQYFRTKELSDKYDQKKFDDMTYSKWILLRNDK